MVMMIMCTIYHLRSKNRGWSLTNENFSSQPVLLKRQDSRIYGKLRKNWLKQPLVWARLKQ